MTTPPQVLFPVAVDPDALLDHPTDRDRLVHREIVMTLEACGTLNLAEVDSDDLFEAIKGLGDLSKTLWTKLLYGLNDLNRIDRTSGAPGVRELLQQLGSSADSEYAVRLIVAGRAASRDRGIDETVGYQTVGRTDIVMAGSIDTAPSVYQAAKTYFAPGTPRESVAESVIRPLAARSASVTVIDPHLFDHVLGTAKPRSVKVGGSWVLRAADHVEWLVTELARQMPSGSTVHLIADYPSQRREDGTQLTKEYVRRVLDTAIRESLVRRSAPIEVNFTLVQAPKSEVKVSNRYLAFDCGFAFLVDHDYYRLGTAVIQAPEDFLLSRLSAEQSERVREIAAGYVNYSPESARLAGTVRFP